MTYDVDYFIEKFDKIPRKSWATKNYVNFLGKKCALGFCNHSGNNPTEEGCALIHLFAYNNLFLILVNDGSSYLGNNYMHLGSHPKERILNALLLIKSGILEDFQ